MKKIAVIGAAGKMGQAVCAAVTQAPDMELVARLDQGDEITTATLAGAEVAIEFTVPNASPANVAALIDAGVDVVVGTTGWDEERLAAVRAQLAASPRADQCVLIAPNFSLSAVIAMAAAQLAARYFEGVEVIETHHPAKVDAPSGTANHTAQLIAQARAEAGLGPSPDATQSDPGNARGAKVAGINVHAVRLPGFVAHEEIIFGNPGEALTIRTDCFDRTSFMGGVLLAAREVQGRAGLIIGLDKVMDLA